MARRSLPASLLVACALTFASSRLWAGARTLPPGQSFLRESLSFYRASSFFDDGGVAHPGDWFDSSTKLRDNEFLHVGEYGLREGLTLTTVLPYKDIAATRAGNANASVAGFGDFSFGVRQRILEGNFVFSVSGQLDLPTGYGRQVNAAEQGRGNFYTLGSGELAFEARALLGGSYAFSWLSGSWDLAAGYRLRGGPYANDATYSAAVGVNPFWRLWLRAGLDGVENLHAAGSFATMTSEQVYNSPSHTSASVAASVGLTRALSFEVGYTADLRGANAFKGRAVVVGIEVRR